jgi:AraC family transcriptional regulator of adaptative response / DNA-3-methyladenine glycosylase II
MTAANPGSDPTAVHTVHLVLPYRGPMDLGSTLSFLGRRAIPHVEAFQPGCFTRVLNAPRGPAQITLSAAEHAVACEAVLTDQHDLDMVVSSVRRLLDLDADSSAVDAQLGADVALAPLVAARPGLRSPGAIDGFEMAIRAVVGQQISVSGARTVLGRIASEHGSRAFDGHDAHLFPSAADFAGLDPATLPMPRARARTLLAVAEACAAGELNLHPGADRDRERAALIALPGIGPWTADYIQMRAMSDPDVLLDTDLGIRRSAAGLGIDLAQDPSRWAPWRSYASHHLWAALH